MDQHTMHWVLRVSWNPSADCRR